MKVSPASRLLPWMFLAIGAIVLGRLLSVDMGRLAPWVRYGLDWTSWRIRKELRRARR